MSDNTIDENGVPGNLPRIPRAVESLTPVAYKGQPVITTESLAGVYGTDAGNIQKNYERNRDRFVDGKHFHKVSGSELRSLKDQPTYCRLVAKNASHLMLWTEMGAARHAKMLETDQAWQVFEKLEDAYFGEDGVKAATARPVKAAEINAASRLIRTILDAVPELGAPARQSLIATTTRMALGESLIELPKIGKEYTTTELAAELGVSPNKLGRFVTKAGLKIDEHGYHRLSKSEHSDKQVSQFYWNEHGREVVLGCFEGQG